MDVFIVSNGCFLARTALKLKIFLSLFDQNRKAAVNGAVWFTRLQEAYM